MPEVHEVPLIPPNVAPSVGSVRLSTVMLTRSAFCGEPPLRNSQSTVTVPSLLSFAMTLSSHCGTATVWLSPALHTPYLPLTSTVTSFVNTAPVVSHCVLFATTGVKLSVLPSRSSAEASSVAL